MAKSVRISARTVSEARMWGEKRRRQRRDRAATASGEATPESMHLIPPNIARKTTGRFRSVTFDDCTRMPKILARARERRRAKV